MDVESSSKKHWLNFSRISPLHPSIDSGHGRGKNTRRGPFSRCKQQANPGNSIMTPIYFQLVFPYHASLFSRLLLTLMPPTSPQTTRTATLSPPTWLMWLFSRTRPAWTMTSKCSWISSRILQTSRRLCRKVGHFETAIFGITLLIGNYSPLSKGQVPVRVVSGKRGITCWRMS